MLLTLAATSLKARLLPRKTKGAPADALNVTDLPRLARENLGLFGLHLTTPMLAGADFARLDAVRDAADKAACPCLTLTEPDPLQLCTENDTVGAAAVDRTIRVVRAAHRLGCNSIGLSISGDDHGDAVDFCIERLREVLAVAERLEMNLLIVPIAGITAEPERLTDLIKRIGGFRVGTFPDFDAAARQPDPSVYLRRIVPYAAAVTVSIHSFKPRKPNTAPVHEPYDLAEFLKVIDAVGYTGTLAIDYRGDGDPIEGLRTAKIALDALLGDPTDDPDLDLIDDEDLPDDEPKRPEDGDE